MYRQVCVAAHFTGWFPEEGLVDQTTWELSWGFHYCRPPSCGVERSYLLWEWSRMMLEKNTLENNSKTEAKFWSQLESHLFRTTPHIVITTVKWIFLPCVQSKHTTSVSYHFPVILCTQFFVVFFSSNTEEFHWFSERQKKTLRWLINSCATVLFFFCFLKILVL